MIGSGISHGCLDGLLNGLTAGRPTVGCIQQAVKAQDGVLAALPRSLSSRCLSLTWDFAVELCIARFKYVFAESEVVMFRPQVLMKSNVKHDVRSEHCWSVLLVVVPWLLLQ